MKTKKERIESAIEKHRKNILNGGDIKYYSRRILELNKLLDIEDNKK